MYSVFLVNFGYTHSTYPNLSLAIAGAEKTDFSVQYIREGDPRSQYLNGYVPKG